MNDQIIEIIGAILAFIYLLLEIKERWTMWLIGIFSSFFYVFIFFKSKVYAQVGLNAYFLLMNIYGLYCWRYSKSEKQEALLITHLTLKTAFILSVISVAFFVFIGKMLSIHTDSPVPYPDALLAALSITATWMVARKIIEVWYVWIVVNLFSVGLYYSLELYPTTILYLVYGIMSFVGLIQWRKSMLKQTKR